MKKQDDAVMADAVVIGGGIVGLAVAQVCTLFFDHVIVLEREERCGTMQSTRNSGVIHPGLHYPTGSLKAQCCVQGNRLLYDFCRRQYVPYRQTGELIVALNETEEVTLAALAAQAGVNGCMGVVMLTPQAVERKQPGVVCTAALFVPTTGIVDVSTLVSSLRRLCVERGVAIVTERWPTAIDQDDRGVRLTVAGRAGAEGSVVCRVCINAAGLMAASIAHMVNPESPWRTVAVRGEYAVTNQPQPAVTMPVYRVPQTYQMPDGSIRQTLGVHLTPTLDDGQIGRTLWIGPSVKVLTTAVDLESDRYSASDIVGQVTPFFPGLDPNRAWLGHAGITPRLLGGATDFQIERDSLVPGVIHLLGIDSPGLTSAFALAAEVCGQFEDMRV